MSTENSSTRWIVGCLVAAVFGTLLICAGGVALLMYWGTRTVRQVAQQAQVTMDSGFQRQIELSLQWQPPAPDAGPDELFPELLGGWVRVASDDSAAIPELSIAADGRHAVYESVGTQVNVYTYQVPQAEQLQVFDRALAAINDAGYSTESRTALDMGFAHWARFSFSPPQRSGRMWWTQDWLIVTMTDNADVDLESFERDYLASISRSPIPEPADAPSEVVPQTVPAPAEPLPTEPTSEETAPDDPDAAPDNPQTAPADPTAEEGAPEPTESQ